MKLRAAMSLLAGGPGSGCNPEAGKCGRTAEERTGKEGRALDRARKDPRQTSLYGPEHTKELTGPIKYTMKSFRGLLNKHHEGQKNHKNHQFHQETRGYGDYLYHQDRGKFDYYFEKFKEAGGDMKKWQDSL